MLGLLGTGFVRPKRAPELPTGPARRGSVGPIPRFPASVGLRWSPKVPFSQIPGAAAAGGLGPHPENSALQQDTGSRWA